MCFSPFTATYRDITLEFDEPMDGILYAAAAALGFASLENILYMFHVFAESRELVAAGEEVSVAENVLTVFTVRACFSVPGHVLASANWGYALGLAKFSKRRRGVLVVAGGLTLSMVSHGLFNAFAGASLPWLTSREGPSLRLLLIPLSYATWLLFARYTTVALRRSPHEHQPVKRISLDHLFGRFRSVEKRDVRNE